MTVPQKPGVSQWSQMSAIFKHVNMTVWIALVILILASSCFALPYFYKQKSYCVIGAFLGDRLTSALVEKFSTDYGKHPAIILTFVDWGNYPDETAAHDVYGAGSVLMVTWEPWEAVRKAAIDYDAVLAGKDDKYIREFAIQMRAIGKPVFLRFAHEMNGDWYPWSGRKIGGEKYRRLFRYIRKIFDSVGTGNVRWVFSINAENVPDSNHFDFCYPGGSYVDYIGLDGYNWGGSRSWGQWRSFRETFSGVYKEAVRRYKKPVIISEFGTTSAGGDKVRWIDEALREVKRMPAVKALVFFNVDKETDWKVVPGSEAGRVLRNGFGDSYFKESWTED